MAERSDFNDLAQEAGSAAVAEIVGAAASKAESNRKSGGNLSGMAKRPAGQRPKPAATLRLLCAANVQPEPIRWLMRGKIALGKLTMIAGDPGLGKSMLTANLAAHVSTGRDWPAGLGPCPHGDVLFVSAEDDPADTIRPRLDAAKANAKRVHIVAGVECLNEQGDQEQRLLSLRKDLQAITDAVRSLDACKLIVVDPISAYLDGADSHNNSDVRGLLAPLSAVASEVGASIVAVTHLNKASGTSAIHRVNGSGAFVAAARAAYIVARDPLEADRRLFLPSKNNLGPDRTGLAYRIEEINGVPYIAWENEAVDISADDALGRPEERDHEETLANAAEEWLREVLALGPVATNDVKSFAKAAGYSWATVRRAQAAIDIKPKRVGGVAGAGQWAWSLPDGEEPDQMPLPGAAYD